MNNYVPSYVLDVRAWKLWNRKQALGIENNCF